MNDQTFHDALSEIVRGEIIVRGYPLTRAIIKAKDQVIGHYSPKFQQSEIKTIDKDVLCDFFALKNNKHWWSIDSTRNLNTIRENISDVRSRLAVMLDNKAPFAQRMEHANEIEGMSKTMLSLVLHVAHPDHYGIWNAASSDSLGKKLHLLSEDFDDLSFGEQYEQVNDLLLTLAEKSRIDLWTLDVIWLVISKPDLLKSPKLYMGNFREIQLPIAGTAHQNQEAMTS